MPGLWVFSARVHSRYQRRLADAAVGGQELTIHLRARRFLCDNSACPRKTFAERFPDLVAPYGRRTLPLRRTREKVALALGGRLHRNTVRRYARAATAAELLTQNPRRGSQLDPFTDYLAMRWEQDCTNAVELTAEIRQRGYRGSERSVRDLVSAWRTSSVPPAAAPKPPPTSRQVTALMMRPRPKLTEDEHAQLRDVLEHCETLRTVNQLVGDFAGMARERHGHHLNNWITAAHASEIPQLSRFAAMLRSSPTPLAPRTALCIGSQPTMRPSPS